MEFLVEGRTSRSTSLDEGRAALARAAAVERRAPDEALALADSVIAMTGASGIAARHLRAEALFQRARALIFRRDLAAAAEDAAAAEGIFIELDDTDGIVRARTAQGAVFSTLGHDEAALELLDDSATLSWSPRVTPMTRMKTLTSRASALRDADRAPESLAGYDQALGIARELGEPEALAALLLNKASATIFCDRLELAERTLGEARALIEEHNVEGLRTWLSALDGTLALSQRDFARARSRAVGSLDAGGDRHARVKAVRTWAQAVLLDPSTEPSDLELARTRLTEVAQEARDRAWHGDLPAICRDLADLHERRGDPAGALRWQREAWAARDLADRSRRQQRLAAERLRLELTRLAVETEQLRVRSEMLAEANTQLAALSEERARLLAVVAHDLRSPLTAISVCIDQSRKRPDPAPDRLRGTLEIIGLSTERMKVLIDEALSTESIRRGQVSPRAHRVDVADLVRRCVAGLSPLAERKAIRVEFEADDVVVDTDAPALSRIVENLLTNALKFTPAGKTVRVTLRREEARAMLRIDDEGPGFQPTELEELFELGRTGAARPTDGEASTGIGLSVVRDLVSALGGDVQLENRDRCGARVTVWLPA